jgi:heme/copper-type cytochrome/quinol oxidase subunit 2
MSDRIILYIVATIILLHVIGGLGWVFWKMRTRNPSENKKEIDT